MQEREGQEVRKGEEGKSKTNEKKNRTKRDPYGS